MFFLVAKDYCESLGEILYLAYRLVGLIKWVVPILLIIFGTLDLAKAVIAGKEDEMKKAQGAFLRRLLYALATFLVFYVVTFVWDMMPSDGDGNTPWSECWKSQAAKKK